MPTGTEFLESLTPPTGSDVLATLGPPSGSDVLAALPSPNAGEIRQAPGFVGRVGERLGMPVTELPGRLAAIPAGAVRALIGASQPTDPGPLEALRTVGSAFALPGAVAGEAVDTGMRAVGLRAPTPITPGGRSISLGDILQEGVNLAGPIAAGRTVGRLVRRPPPIPVPQAAEVAAPITEDAARVAPIARELLEPTPAIPARAVAAETVRVPPIEPTPLTAPQLQETHSRQIVNAAGDLFERAGAVRDPNRLLADQVAELLGSDQLALPEIQAVLQTHGLTTLDLANGLFRPGVKDAAQKLQALSAVAKRLKGLATPEELSELGALASELDEGARAQSWWRRADNVRRGLLVTQLATAVRNAETQVGRLGLDAMQSALDAGLQRLFGLPKTASALDGMELFLNLVRRGNKAEVETILRQFPRESDRLFGIYASDIAKKGASTGGAADRLFGAAEAGVDALNVANRFQEYVTRRAVFLTKLGQGMRRQGQDLETVLAAGGEIPEPLVKEAVRASLEMTFAESPRFGGVAHSFVRLVNQLPGATLAVPFPRFLTNSVKFFYDFSPAGFLKVIGPAERARIAAGDTAALSRATIGTALFGTAYQIRNSEYAGDAWYQLKLPDGRLIDTRPFNPFAAYLFAADLVTRAEQGRLYTLTAKDLVTGILSARAGTSLYLVDQLLSSLTAGGATEHIPEKLKALAGETVAGVLTPLRQLQDVMAEFNPEQMVVREKRLEPFLGPIKAAVPGLAETLPLALAPTREAPLVREEPLLRQLTGVIVQSAPNSIERELTRLGFERRMVLPSTQDPELDRLLTGFMGRAVERGLSPVVQAPTYQALTDAQKGLVLDRALGQARKAAAQATMQTRPDLWARLQLGRNPLRTRLVLQELGITPEAIAP